MQNKKVFCAILAAMLLSGFGLTACSSGGGTETKSGGANTETETQAETETETEATMATVSAQYTGRDYGGYAVRIADRDAQGDWDTFDVYAEEITGEVINDAVYSRNTLMEELLNIKIEERAFADPTGSTKTSITAGSDDFDMITDGLNSLSTLSTGGLLLDYNTISTIHPENEWWDQAMYRDLSVLNHVYFMTGDISVMDNYGTWCYLFNKDMVSDLGLENPYTLVNEGKWTLDKHNEMAAAALMDVDGDGKWTDADTYGLITEDYNNLALWSSMGYKLTDKDDKDMPYFSYDSEASLTALASVVQMQYSDVTNLGSKSTVKEGGGVETENGRERQFAIGGALFYYAGMRNITLFRDSDVTFGILPAPKENEAQKEYYSCWSFCNLTAYVLPKTLSDPERTGDVMEIMAHLSVYSLTPAYMEQTLIGKASRDAESEPMIYLILDNRNYDLGIVFDWGSTRSMIFNLKDPDVIVSKLEKVRKNADTALAKYIATIEEVVE